MDQDTNKNKDVVSTVNEIEAPNTFRSKDTGESITTSQEASFKPESRAHLLSWKYSPCKKPEKI
jgi:hypothetical protein